MAASNAAERIGVVVVRVWIEQPPGTGLRARITAQELGDGEQTSKAAKSIDAIVDNVRAWLEEFVNR